MKVIIIDDEEASAELLELKLRKLQPEIDIAGIYTRAKEGLNAIEVLKPEVVFLDIEMPSVNGINIARQIDSSMTEIVFTTAYHQYAIEAVRLHALDYLLKPIKDTELEETLLKAEEKLSHKRRLLASNPSDLLLQQLQLINSQYNKIPLSTTDGILFVELKEIVYVEGINNYSKVCFLDGKSLVTSRTLKYLEDQLSGYRFIRPHKSFLVNMMYIRKYVRSDSSYLLLTGDVRIEVSRQRKADILRMLGEI